MRRTRLPSVLTLAALLLLPTATLRAADPVPASQLLPSNVHVFVATPSVTELRQKWDQTLIGQLADDPAIADFCRDLETQFDQVSEQARQQLGVSLKEVLDVPSGQVALAVVQQPNGKFGLVALLDFGENRETVDKLLEKAQTALADNGAKRAVEDVADTQVTVYTFPNEGNPRGLPAQEQKLAYFLKDTTFVVGNGVEALEGVLSRWDGDQENTFADNQAFRYIVDRCREGDSESVLTWYIDPVGLATAAVQSFGQGNIGAQMGLAMLPQLGLNKLKAIGGSLDIATERFDSVSRTMIYVDQPAGGVLGAFEFPAIEQSPPDWVPADASGYMGLNWDLNSAYETIGTLVDQFQGPGKFAGLIEALAEKPDGPKLHLKQDILDQLTGRIHVVIDVPEDAGPNEQRFLIGLGAKDVDKLSAALTAAADTPGFPGKAREFRGHTVYDFPKQGPGGGDGEGSLCIARNHLLIASDVAVLERVLRNDQDDRRLVDTEEYRQLAAQFPGKTSILGFQRQERQIKSIYEMLRGGEGLPFAQGLDFSKLPPFEAIQKYLPATASYAVPDKNGALFVSYSLAGGAKQARNPGNSNR